MAERYDVLVIGSGPAGLTAAHAAARQGVRVGLVDAQALPGGQVWRHDVRFSAPAFARRCMQATLEHIKIDWLPQTRVVGAEPGRLLVEDPRSARWLKYGALVLA
ncbi:MAG: FAD-dependent oxidoreductase, partial [Gammaproteobacteria bacterium]|nr:FAD-dependent oxidoreductase [Gammaproteobacteria bacterium]